RRQDAVRLHETNTSLRQTDTVAIPKRELPAHEIRIVEDRVESCGLAISRIPIALRPEERTAKTKVVFIDGRFHGRHLRTDMHAAPSDRITIVAAESIVIRIRQ